MFDCESADAAVGNLVHRVEKSSVRMDREKRRRRRVRGKRCGRQRPGLRVELRLVDSFSRASDIYMEALRAENSRGAEESRQRSYHPIPLVFVRSLQT